MKLVDLFENGMYSNSLPKRAKAHTPPKMPSPDDIFIGPSVDRKGKIGVALKGRTAYISPTYAKELAGKLTGYADEIEQESASELNENMSFKATAKNKTGDSFQFFFSNYNWNGIQAVANSALAKKIENDDFLKKGGPWTATNIDVS